MVEYPVNITFKTDRQSLRRVDKKVKKSVGTQEISTQSQQSGDGGGGGGGALAGGVIVGALLSPLKSIASGIGSMVKGVGKLTRIVPIITGLLKPFLALFLVIGFLLLRALGAGTPQEGGQKAIEGLGVGAGAIGGAALGGPIGAVIGAALTWVAIELSKTFGEWLGELTADLHNLRQELQDRFLNWVNELTDGRLFEIASNIKEIFELLWENFQALLSFDFQTIWTNLKELGPLIFNTLKLIFESSFIVLGKIGQWIWETLTEIFVKSFELLQDFGSWIWDNLTSMLSSSFETLKGIGSWIRDRIQSAIGSIGGGLRSAASFVPGINDGIITPRGDVIRTNPRDYVMASRNPQDLMGGGGQGQAPNITININGNVDNNVYEKMKRELARELGGRIRF